MEALFIFLGSEYGSTFALASVFTILSRPPDYGAGQLDTKCYGVQYASKGEDADLALLPEQTPLYKDMAAVAVQSGICMAIFAVANAYTYWASWKFISIESRGSLILYSNTDESTPPQDMYRMLSHPYAFNCILRLRTSTKFKSAHSYGHFFPDPQYENVQHIICCNSYVTYTYDFEFANDDGFSRHTSEILMVQMTFQYTVVVPPEEFSNSGPSAACRSQHSLQKRLRIRTVLSQTSEEGEIRQTPAAILDRRLRKRRNKPATMVLVHGYNGRIKVQKVPPGENGTKSVSCFQILILEDKEIFKGKGVVTMRDLKN